MTQPPSFKIIVGLGNPGVRYAHTYHNAGREALELLRARFVPRRRTAHEPLFDYVRTPASAFVEPKAYMNESGPAVRAALKFFGAAMTELLVLHDDSDLPLGEARLELGRSAAGHHGVESVITALKTKGFWRLRIGVRPVPAENKKIPHRKAGDFVLKRMSENDLERIQLALGGTIVKLIENDQAFP
jgi:peptidyl-tRNA hydrolase, PTH1 family